MSQSARHQLLLAGLAASVFFVNLGATRLWDIDEAIFSQAAAEMYQRGDYVVPYFNDQLFPDKPALMYWLMIVAYQVFGVNEFAARFWSAVFGLGTVLLTYQLGRRLFSPVVGFWAGLILATNVNFGVIARAATPDSLLTFFSTLALFIFVRGALKSLSENRLGEGDSPILLRGLRKIGTVPGGSRMGSTSRDVSSGLLEPGIAEQPQAGLAELTEPGWGTYALAYAAMGAGVLVKGPVGVILPTAVVGLLLLLTRGANRLAQLPAEAPRGPRWARSRRLLDALVRTFAPGHFLRTIWRMRPLTALVAVLAVAGPWYVWVGLRTDGEWPTQFFGVQNFGRFLSAMDNHRGPVVYYLGIIMVLFFPWSILLGASLLELVRRTGRRSGYRAGAMLVACWLAVYLGFFSAASTKLPNYIIPCYPALALMTALFVERWTSHPESVPRPWLWVAFGILGLAGLSIVVATPAVAGLLAEPDWTLGLVGLVPIAGALAGFWFTWRWEFARAAGSLGITAAALTVWLFGVSAVQADRFQNSQAFVDTIDELSDGPANVATFRYFRPSMVFYGHRPIKKLGTADDVPTFFSDHPRDAFLYTLDEQLPTLSKLLPDDVTVLETHRRLFKSGRILLLGRAANPPRWSEPAGDARVGQASADAKPKR